MSEELVVNTDIVKSQLESNKAVREILAWAHFKLQHVPTIPEEHVNHGAAIAVLAEFCKDLQKKIEAEEPPQVEVVPEAAP